MSVPATAGRLTSLRRLDRRVALITGGGSGAGAAIARRCAALGASVVVADIDFALAGEVAASLRAEGIPALAHRCDVAVEEQVLTPSIAPCGISVRSISGEQADPGWMTIPANTGRASWAQI